MATRWEFRNRALLFGIIINVAFAFYLIDQKNAADLLTQWVGRKYTLNPDLLIRLVFVIADVVMIAASLFRTFASAYMNSAVVYGAEVKTQTLVADGPYRWVRNPLYFANVLMAIALSSLMTRAGAIVVVVAMVVFCYRLILREESDFRAADGTQYNAYFAAVPRLLPAVFPRTPGAGSKADFAAGIKAESWVWSFTAGLVAFTFTLNLGIFFGAVAASIALLWFHSKGSTQKSEKNA